MRGRITLLVQFGFTLMMLVMVGWSWSGSGLIDWEGLCLDFVGGGCGIWGHAEVTSGGSGYGGDYGDGWGAQVANAEFWAGALDGHCVSGPGEGGRGHSVGGWEGWERRASDCGDSAVAS